MLSYELPRQKTQQTTITDTLPLRMEYLLVANLDRTPAARTPDISKLYNTTMTPDSWGRDSMPEDRDMWTRKEQP